MVRTRVEAVAARLRAVGVPAPEADARWLDASFGQDPDALEAAVRRRTSREPLQLILGTAAFRHLEVEVAPAVFIPRPETEVLVDLALDRLTAGAVVAEPCTGTGAIACALAVEADPSHVVATDSSARAVALARRNAAAFPAVDVRCGDLLAPLDASVHGHLDMIVSNPPYLTAAQVAAAEPEVRDWDPTAALVGGPDGRAVSRRIVRDAARWLRPGGWLLLEDDPERVEDVAAEMRSEGFTDVAVRPDLVGRSRFALGRKRQAMTSAAT